MQTDLQHELEQLGFTERQASVYLALLRFGKSGAQQLALASGVPRASCYDTLQQLINQGLAKAAIETGQQLFYAESPDRIKMLLALQFEEISTRRRRVEQFLPQLMALAGDGEIKPRFRIISDTLELFALHQEYADMCQPFLQLVGYDAYLKLYRESVAQENFERLQRQQVVGRAILVTDKNIEVPVGAKVEIRKVPPAMLDVKGELTVCGDHVLLFAYTKDIAAIEIVSPTIAVTCLAALELSWQRAGVIEKQLLGVT